MTWFRNTQSNWVYRLTVEQVSLIFEANDLKPFGLFFRGRKLEQFNSEYNQLFNKQNNQLGNEISRLRLYLKHLKLMAMYDSLLYAKGENALFEFRTMFNSEYTKPEQLKLITDENTRILEKIQILTPKETVKKENTITFNDLVLIIETSRNMAIDRKMKLWEFKKVYDLELKKWQTQKQNGK